MFGKKQNMSRDAKRSVIENVTENVTQDMLAGAGLSAKGGEGQIPDRDKAPAASWKKMNKKLNKVVRKAVRREVRREMRKQKRKTVRSQASRQSVSGSGKRKDSSTFDKRIRQIRTVITMLQMTIRILNALDRKTIFRR